MLSQTLMKNPSAFSLLRARYYRAYSSKRLTIGIRNETKNRWERRCPFTPDEVSELVKVYGGKVVVQPSKRRFFPDEAFRKSGAKLSSDLSEADVIFGVKEIPTTYLLPNKTYVFFSHTFKGQPYNMPMLKHIMDNKITLIDYELLKDKNQKRLVMFGRHAGYVGMIDSFHGLGQRLLGLGYNSPFMNVGLSYTYRSLQAAKDALGEVKKIIHKDGLPSDLGPLVFTFTGKGNVSQGAREVFDVMPHEYISPANLKDFYESKDYDRKKVYGVLVDVDDYLFEKSGKEFVQEEYFANPENYESNFHETIAPYSSVIMNGNYWDKRCPRLLTSDQMEDLVVSGRNRLLFIGDISADINGSFEFMDHYTQIEDPFFIYDPISRKNHKDMIGRGVMILSVENLPCELPNEASKHFGQCLLPYAVELLKGNYDNDVIKRATIVRNGVLTEPHKHLIEAVKKHQMPVSSDHVVSGKKILLLGSGFVAGPVVDYFASNSNQITIASNSLNEAKALAKNRPGIHVSLWDANDQAELASMVDKHDIVVSLIPAPLHPVVAEICIEKGKHLVTASYVSPTMSALHEKAKKAGITILNEVGLDPGIDHLTAMKIIDQAKSEGSKVESFQSWCGGLPAPESSDNPIGYKFSWSPRGVLTAAMNQAKFKINGEVKEIPGSELLRNVIKDPIPEYRGFKLEGLANRDSLQYITKYGLPPVGEMKTMFRGTLRYEGFSEIMSNFQKLGLLDPNEAKKFSWKGFWNSEPNIIAKRTGLSPSSAEYFRLLSALKYFNIHPDCHNTVSDGMNSNLDSLCHALLSKLRYKPNERDMVLLHHRFGILHTDSTRSVKTSTLIAYGDPNKYSAMALTVGIPAAIGADLILQGVIKKKGVVIPTTSDVYEPMLKKLDKYDIKVVEKSQSQ